MGQFGFRLDIQIDRYMIGVVNNVRLVFTETAWLISQPVIISSSNKKKF